MNKRKICVVITARPSYSRIKTALTAIKEHPDLELQLVIAGSALLDRYGNAADFIIRDGFEINEKVFMVLEGENPTAMAKTTGLGVMELANVFYNLRPDAVITIADRFETIATSIAAAYQNIPLVHVQGGEVTGSIDEKVRHANTKLADLHLVASEEARERVIRLGEDPRFVINTGC
ncbi:MAG: UDP-N-acetylglucosamine 2-epimerase, partial [Leeuwenhoekiella sp.]